MCKYVCVSAQQYIRYAIRFIHPYAHTYTGIEVFHIRTGNIRVRWCVIRQSTQTQPHESM